MARPLTCGKCGTPLVSARGYAERLDPVDRVIVGFLDCPHCQAVYVYIRKAEPGGA